VVAERHLLCPIIHQVLTNLHEEINVNGPKSKENIDAKNIKASIDAVSIDAVSIDAVSIDAVSIDAVSIDASVEAGIDAVSVDANIKNIFLTCKKILYSTSKFLSFSSFRLIIL